jgi:hypothetical protein
MITPAVLISAPALLVLSTSNRLGRVIDRIRLLSREAESRGTSAAPPADDDQKHGLMVSQLDNLLKRLLLLRTAVTVLYVTIATLVATSIATGIFVIFPRMTAWAPIVVGLLGAVLFLYSIMLLVREAALAVQATIAEVDYIRGLIHREQ